MKADLFESIEKHATSAPTSIAVACNGRGVTYVDLRALVETASDELRNLGVMPRDVIASHIADPLQNWITTLAMMHCGAVPCLLAASGTGVQSLTPDFLIVHGAGLEPAVAPFAHVRRLPLPSGRSDGRGQFPVAQAAGDDVAQIILSSGTTGPAKAVPLTWATIEQRTRLRDGYFPIDGPVLSLMQPGTAGGLQTCLAALKHGLAVDVSNEIEALVRAAEDPAMRYIIGSPGQLATLIRAMDASGVRAGRIRACLLMGGAVSRHLQEAAGRVFGGSVMALYGSTELGACATCAAAGEAHAMQLLTGVQAQAVSDAGAILPEGEDGALRFKAPGMAESYFLSPAETARSFEDGWFYPGDIGSVLSGRIHLSGRSDEIINLAGAKYDPADIDEYIERLGLATDAAAFKFTDINGNESLIIAAVASSDRAYAQLKADFRNAVRPLHCPVGFFRVNAIARNAMGKPLRAVLAEQMKQAMVRATAPPVAALPPDGRFLPRAAPAPAHGPKV